MSKRAARVTGSLTLEELNQAAHVIVRSVQNECFLEDVKALKKDKEVKKSRKLASLAVVCWEKWHCPGMKTRDDSAEGPSCQAVAC